jgi:hemolysin activation/secretion protein
MRLVSPAYVLSALLAAGAATAQPADAPDALTAVDSMRLTDVAVEGSTVFSAGELDALTAPYEQRSVSFEDLQELRHELSRRYADQGYVTSGVLIPEQRVQNGVLVLQAVEGELSGIAVEGNRRLRTKPIEKRVLRHVDSPLNIADLQAGLNELQSDALVERVNAELVPGERLGESYLKLGITERRPFEIGVIAANDRSASIGEDRVALAFTYRGLVGNGDALSARIGVTDGADDNALTYEVPLTARGTKLLVALSEQDSDIIEEPFAAIDIESHIETWSVTASRPFLDDGVRSLVGLLGFEHKESESTLLGEPFSFSAGDVDGEAVGSAFTAGVEWSKRLGSRTLAARGTFQVGVNALDPTRNEELPDGDFALFIGQLQYVQGIAWRESRVLVRGLMQVADDALLAMYKLPVGGRYTVRGYRENQLVRDHGFVASAEYQFPLLVDDTGRRRAGLDLAVFADFGVSVDELASPFTPRREHLSSAGLGLLWRPLPLPGFSLEVYRAEPFEDVGNPDETLQDRGIHYNLTYNRAF